MELNRIHFRLTSLAILLTLCLAISNASKSQVAANQDSGTEVFEYANKIAASFEVLNARIAVETPDLFDVDHSANLFLYSAGSIGLSVDAHSENLSHILSGHSKATTGPLWHRKGIIDLRISRPMGQANSLLARPQTSVFVDSLHALKKKWHRRRNLTLVSTILFTGAGIAAKLLANHDYNRYREADKSNKAKDLRKSVDSLDRYSRASFAMGGAFGILTLFNQVRKTMVRLP